MWLKPFAFTFSWNHFCSTKKENFLVFIKIIWSYFKTQYPEVTEGGFTITWFTYLDIHGRQIDASTFFFNVLPAGRAGSYRATGPQHRHTTEDGAVEAIEVWHGGSSIGTLGEDASEARAKRNIGRMAAVLPRLCKWQQLIIQRLLRRGGAGGKAAI